MILISGGHCIELSFLSMCYSIIVTHFTAIKAIAIERGEIGKGREKSGKARKIFYASSLWSEKLDYPKNNPPLLFLLP